MNFIANNEKGIMMKTLEFALVLFGATFSHATTVLTATGRTSLHQCKSWQRTSLTEKRALQDDAVLFASDEMKAACDAQGPSLTSVVQDVTVRGYKCATLAEAGLYLMDVSFTCEQ